MARPPKSGLDWFRHDTDAASDLKIEMMRTLYGNDGYAFFFLLLEYIYRTPEQAVDISDAETILLLSSKVKVDVDKFERMLASSIKYGLFSGEAYEDGWLTSPGIQRRAMAILEKRKKMRSGYVPKGSEERAPTPSDPDGFYGRNDMREGVEGVEGGSEEGARARAREGEAPAGPREAPREAPRFFGPDGTDAWEGLDELKNSLRLALGDEPKVKWAGALRALMNPKGAPVGCRDGKGGMHNGYSREQLLVGLEQFSAIENRSIDAFLDVLNGTHSRFRMGQGREGGDGSGSGETWWILTHEQAQQKAAKLKVSFQPEWPRFKGPDGKAYYVMPEHRNRLIPSTFTEWPYSERTRQRVQEQRSG